LFGADATVSHTRTGRRHGAQKIFPLTIHTTETLCEASTGRVCHTLRISNAAITQSVLSICPIASAKRANQFSLDSRRTSIRTLATYRFLIRHALPLSQRRILRPQHGRGETAIRPGEWPLLCPQPRSVRVRSGAVSSPKPRTVHDRIQSVSRLLDWPGNVRDAASSFPV
jgi:hypothetical protein